MAGSEAFDAVVVGAGAAGCVVAARLAESGSRSVLLLEAGPDLRAEAPDEIRDAWHITRDFDWGYRSEPNPRGDVQNLWRNKLVGGTSWVTRFAPRGSPADYDEWAALGNAGWSFDDVLPYFRHLEADADFGDTPWHGDSGPMPVRRYSGVRLLDGDVVEASRVVLCAGVFGSPAILMRSGIGPADHLRSVEVPVRVDLPGVGANLADHPAVSIECGYSGATRTDPILHVIATFHSATMDSNSAPDLMLWASDPEAPAEGPASFDIDVVLVRPRSRGGVRLRSADPTDAPHVELPAPSDPFDVERLAEGYLRGLEVLSSGTIRRHGVEPATPAPLGDELLEFVRVEGYSLPHVVGTCAMGPRPEDGAVVDPSGQVHGTEALSVVDASIMPDVPSGFTHVPTIMLAERLSERIAST
jgi:choline dehydrogenase-like flavoprotein